MPTQEEIHVRDNRLRSTYSEKVVSSVSPKRLVMAGPGTGKSYLFQQVAKILFDQGKENILVLTFINELVKDLAVDMHGLAEVSTLHSFAAKKLGNKQNIYLDLINVIEADYKAEKGLQVNLSELIHNLRTDHPEVIEYLQSRRAYYKAYDPSSIVFDLVNLYSQDESKIPEYDLILVDEYQDFNPLEAKLIELLATKSSVLMAGDDDQCLYSFKHSKADNIRAMYKSGEYETFELPYCSRSTSVVIDAFHDFVASAKANGHLAGRIEKQYLYFSEPKKDGLSATHPKIVSRKQVFEPQNAFAIDQAIRDIFIQEPKFDVLIICSLKKQIKPLAEKLRKKGYSNVSGDEFGSTKNQRLAEGLNLLAANKDSDLGWRLSAESLMDDIALRTAVINSQDCHTPFFECLPDGIVAEVKKLRAISIKLEKGTQLSAAEQDLLFMHLAIDPRRLGEDDAREKIFNDRSSGGIHSSVKIKITTILGSKGLSYDYVFLVNFDDRYLIPSTGIDDESINKFLVALTRSRKKVFIYTNQARESTFTSWISSDRKLQS